jgi:hypothetical protein
VSELAARIAAIEARQAIADLVHGYARAIRHDRPEDVPALFAPDGWFEIRDGHPSQAGFTVRTRLDSPAAILAYLLPGKGKPHPVPMIHNLMVDLDLARAVASATSVMEAPVIGTPHRVMGEYRDSFRRIGNRWLFASRIYTIFSAASSV